MPTMVWSSVTRVIERGGLDVSWEPRPRGEWADGDYLAAEVRSTGGVIEAPDGHYIRVEPGDVVIGALGARRATLEVVGDWRGVAEDGRIHSLTRGGVLGLVTSAARDLVQYVIEMRYLGHLRLGGAFTGMTDWALPPGAGPRASATPAIVLIGTSMSSGKTTAARTLIRRLAAMGLTVAGTKLAGVARYSDVLSMRDAGAATILDFVDAGLPSTVAPRDVVSDAARRVLAAVDARAPDVLVAEAGASPLEPYRGDAVFTELADRIRLTILCASDPYAVVGAERAFGLRPDLVAGRSAATSASIALVFRLSGIEAMDVSDPAQRDRVDEILAAALGVPRPSGAPRPAPGGGSASD